MYVKQSCIDGAGGGLFSGRTLAEDEYLETYKGIHVKAATMRAPGYVRGYIMRVGPKYVDARDITGQLRLANGTIASVNAFTHADWGQLASVGIEWIGESNLSRFVNEAEEDHNVIFRRGKLYTLREIPPNTELVVSAYGGDFWRGDDGDGTSVSDASSSVQGDDTSAASTALIALSSGTAGVSIERPTKKVRQADLCDAALLTRELERAWIWYGQCKAMPVATTEGEVEAWADRHLRSDVTDELLSGTAIVLGAGSASLPPRLTWAASASEDMPTDRREYAEIDGMLDLLARAGGSDQLELHTPSRAERPTVAALRAMLREGVHPAIEQPMPLITELPPFRRTDAQSVRLRSAILSLLGGEEAMLPRAWLEEDNGTVLGMLNEPMRRSVLFVLAMHSRCNLEVHVDALGTGVKELLRTQARPALGRPPGSELRATGCLCARSRHVPPAPRDQARAGLASDGSEPRGARELPTRGVRTPTARSDPTVRWRRRARPTVGRADDHRTHGHPPRGQSDTRPVDRRELQLPVVRRAAHAPQRDPIIASQRYARRRLVSQTAGGARVHRAGAEDARAPRSAAASRDATERARRAFLVLALHRAVGQRRIAAVFRSVLRRDVREPRRWRPCVRSVRPPCDVRQQRVPALQTRAAPRMASGGRWWDPTIWTQALSPRHGSTTA